MTTPRCIFCPGYFFLWPNKRQLKRRKVYFGSQFKMVDRDWLDGSAGKGACKPEDQSSVPRTHIQVEEEDEFHRVVPWSPYMHSGLHTPRPSAYLVHIYTLIMHEINVFKESIQCVINETGSWGSWTPSSAFKPQSSSWVAQLSTARVCLLNVLQPSKTGSASESQVSNMWARRGTFHT